MKKRIFIGILSLLFVVCGNKLSAFFLSGDLKISHEHFYVMGNKDFKNFVRSYKEAIAFGNSSNAEDEMDEVERLLFRKGQFFKFQFATKEAQPQSKRNFKFEFDGKDKISKIYTYFVKETYQSDFGPIVHFVYHYVIVVDAPAQSALKVIYPDGTIKRQYP